MGLVLALVLALPFLVRAVEHNLEVFLFVMGLAAASISGALSRDLWIKALKEPVAIAGAVLVAGFLFRLFRKRMEAGASGLLKKVPIRMMVFFIILVLGLASSIITAIIASLVLVELIGVLRLDRRATIRLSIVACFAIGLGATLTPVGEPLATIAISKMGGDFWYLVRLLGPYIIPGVVALAVFGAIYAVPAGEAAGRNGRLLRAGGRGTGTGDSEGPGSEESEEEGWSEGGEPHTEVFLRAGKVYLFVMALVLLGEGFKPAIDRFVVGLSSRLLYWLNMVSAILDNATLTAAEISAKMSPLQVKAVLLGLLISGGMLIPGNIPNIITAGKLKISSKEWAALGVPLGLALMFVFFAIVFA